MTRALIILLCLGGLPLTGLSAVAATPFELGEQAEKELRIYDARDLFRQALRETPAAPGVAEHTAWFLYLNGFHDEECRDLLRQAMPQAQQPAAMERAARHIERELGLRPPAEAAEQEEQRAFHRTMVEQATGGTDEQLGGALVDAGDYDRGIPLLEKALAADPTNGPLELRLARAYVWSQKLPAADATYERLLQRHPGNPALLLEQGQVAARRTLLERAQMILAAAEQARPGEQRILNERKSVEAQRAQLAAAAQEKPAAVPKEALPALSLIHI